MDMDMEKSQELKLAKEKAEANVTVKQEVVGGHKVRWLVLSLITAAGIIGLGIFLFVHFTRAEKMTLTTPVFYNLFQTINFTTRIERTTATTLITKIPVTGALLSCTGDEELAQLAPPDTDVLLEKFKQHNRSQQVADNYQQNCRYYFYMSRKVRKDTSVDYLTARFKCRAENTKILDLQSALEACRIVRHIQRLEQIQKADETIVPHDLLHFPKSLWIDQHFDEQLRLVRESLMCPGSLSSMLDQGYYAALDFSQTSACIKVVPRAGNRQFVCKKCFEMKIEEEIKDESDSIKEERKDESDSINQTSSLPLLR